MYSNMNGFAVILVSLCVTGALANIRMTSTNPEDASKYFCTGEEASTASDIYVEFSCPNTDSTFVNDVEVSGCRLEAGDPVVVKTSFVPSQDASTLRQKAFTHLGKKVVGMPGLKSLFCDGTDGVCARQNRRMEHTMDVKIPPVIPLDLVGQMATFLIADQDGQNLVCIKMPVFVSKGIAASLKKKKKN